MARVKSFCFADIRKIVLHWITTAGRKENVSTAAIPTIYGINFRGPSVEIFITILLILSEVSWDSFLLNANQQNNILPILKVSIFI
jgi:hypothetical protein